MKKIKILKKDDEQIIRLPKEYRIAGTEVTIARLGDIVFMVPNDQTWSGFKTAIEMFSDDFYQEEREQGENQERESLD